jgi:hypothetical protein
MAIKGFGKLTLIYSETFCHFEALGQYEFCQPKYNLFVEGELLTVFSKKRDDFLLQRQPEESFDV